MDIDQLCRTVRTPADLRNLPGYVEKVNPAQVGLRRVVWPYGFASETHCALTNCGTPHKAGVIIELEDGTVSNIGHVCGADKDKFSSKFTVEMLKLSESRRREAMLPILLDRPGLEGTERQARAAYHEAENWVRRVAAFAAVCPEADRELRRRINGGASMAVVDVVERPESEVSDLIASGQARNRAAARYKEIEKGVIRGSVALSLTEQRISSLWRRADALLAANPQAVEIAALQKLFNESVHLPEDARRVLEECEAARVFFTPGNFALMAMLPMSQKGRDLLNALTVDILDNSAMRPLVRQALANAAGDRPLNKKQRDLQRKMEAIQRAARRMRLT
ncbi:hypothetical protein RI103_39485 (plasmid) [Paraburkholderia sp. FT54]|uniref:hypothetical protein n=1 Tax=Paraburkholderia sp. FT54 TaxID=3074437 RepID=UPI0028779C62|nr:hypothetical protein [Paraburkholderia sp. FT54]WNC95576.1 hypothetical protein RI103_39485 [Paraburkholderia sp. FT54]